MLKLLVFSQPPSPSQLPSLQDAVSLQRVCSERKAQWNDQAEVPSVDATLQKLLQLLVAALLNHKVCGGMWWLHGFPPLQPLLTSTGHHGTSVQQLTARGEHGLYRLPPQVPVVHVFCMSVVHVLGLKCAEWCFTDDNVTPHRPMKSLELMQREVEAVGAVFTVVSVVDDGFVLVVAVAAENSFKPEEGTDVALKCSTHAHIQGMYRRLDSLQENLISFFEHLLVNFKHDKQVFILFYSSFTSSSFIPSSLISFISHPSFLVFIFFSFIFSIQHSSLTLHFFPPSPPLHNPCLCRCEVGGGLCKVDEGSYQHQRPPVWSPGTIIIIIITVVVVVVFTTRIGIISITCPVV